MKLNLDLEWSEERENISHLRARDILQDMEGVLFGLLEIGDVWSLTKGVWWVTILNFRVLDKQGELRCFATMKAAKMFCEKEVQRRLGRQ